MLTWKGGCFCFATPPFIEVGILTYTNTKYRTRNDEFETRIIRPKRQDCHNREGRPATYGEIPRDVGERL